MPAPGWHSDPQGTLEVYLGKHPGAEPGWARPLLILMQQFKGQEFGFGFHSGFVSQDTPGLGRALQPCSLCYSRRLYFAHCGTAEGAGFAVALANGPNLPLLLGTVGADCF